jgi:hypothetical protein
MATVKKTSKMVEITISPQEFLQGTFPEDPAHQGGHYVGDMARQKLKITVCKSAKVSVVNNQFVVTFEL